jgi:hypothetical protein
MVLTMIGGSMTLDTQPVRDLSVSDLYLRPGEKDQSQKVKAIFDCLHDVAEQV